MFKDLIFPLMMVSLATYITVKVINVFGGVETLLQ